MPKSPDAFRTISEVADWLGVQAHVLRFWESKFAQVKPVKRAGGRRYYRPADMQLLGGIKKLLHDDGLTIKGAQKIIREQGVAEVSLLSPPLDANGPGSTEAEPAGATIVRFTGRGEGEDQSVAAPAEPAEPGPQEAPMAAQPGPAQGDAEAPAPAGGDPARPDPDPPAEAQPAGDDPGETPATETAPAEAAETAPADTPPQPAASPETGPASAPAEPESEAARLPSFLHRAPAPATPDGDAAAEPGSPAMAAAPETQSGTESPAAPRARVIEAPDPPDEAQIPAGPGLLTRLSAQTGLSPAQAAQIAPLAADLKAWLARQDSPRAG